MEFVRTIALVYGKAICMISNCVALDVWGLRGVGLDFETPRQILRAVSGTFLGMKPGTFKLIGFIWL